MINFDTAYQWLNEFDRTYLGPAPAQLVVLLQNELRHFNRQRVYQTIHHLIDIADRVGIEEERAEARVVCAWAAYQMNDLLRAYQYLQEAGPLYEGMNHQKSIAQWLAGCVLWAMTAQPRYEEAIVAWQRSLQEFERLQFYYSMEDPRAYAWYRDRAAEMNRAIIQKTQSLRMRAVVQSTGAAAAWTGQSSNPPEMPQNIWVQEYPEQESPIPVQLDVLVTGAKEPPVEKEPAGLEEDLFSTWLQTFAVSGSIPAGGFGPVGVDPHPDGYVHIDRVMIQGEPYRIMPVRKNGSVINLSGFISAGKQFSVLRVKGDSMDQAGIESGDYVLVLMQNTARDGDIVVAGVIDVEAEATIKRFRRRGTEIELVPESSNPDHPVRSFPSDMEGLAVSGVVLACFKPVE